jgi:hypothetical protein
LLHYKPAVTEYGGALECLGYERLQGMKFSGLFTTNPNAGDNGVIRDDNR